MPSNQSLQFSLGKAFTSTYTMEAVVPGLEIEFHTWANTTRYKQQRMVQITVDSCIESDEMWIMRYPKRRENLPSFKGIYHRYMITDLFEPTVYTMTASINGEIVGNAVWELQGKGVDQWPEVVQRDSWLLCKFSSYFTCKMQRQYLYHAYA